MTLAFMRRIAFAPVNFTLALAIIATVSVTAGTLLAYRTARAFGMNVGSWKITKVEECESGEALGIACPRCPFCSKLGSACATYTEITYLRSGGTPGEPAICVPKGWLYRGGGAYPKVGAKLKAKMITPFVPLQVGVSQF